MAESNGLPDARLSCPDVYIDGEKLPGLIAENGVRVTPGDHRSINRVSVDFLVGKVTVDDPHVGVATVEVAP